MRNNKLVSSLNLLFHFQISPKDTRETNTECKHKKASRNERLRKGDLIEQKI